MTQAQYSSAEVINRFGQRFGVQLADAYMTHLILEKEIEQLKKEIEQLKLQIQQMSIYEKEKK